MEHFDDADMGAVKSSVEGYMTQSFLLDERFLDLKEDELIAGLNKKGFSFPTNEGMRKVTKRPELEKIDDDPVLYRVASNIRDTIGSVRSNKKGGLYAGVNAFHHGHLAYCSRSEAIVAVDMNKLIPYGFAFIVGLVGGIEQPEDFRKQVSLMAAEPERLRDFFQGTDLEQTALVTSESEEADSARRRLLTGLLSTMNEFNPNISSDVPPVFCNDRDTYNYFRELILKDKVSGITSALEGKGFVKTLTNAIEGMDLDRQELNTMYVSSCFDPRFIGPEGRKAFVRKLQNAGFSDFQMIESFLNSGWVIYDVEDRKQE
jgi:hypothetical protein